MSSSTLLRTRRRAKVNGFTREARDIVSLELVAAENGGTRWLPPFTAGAHIDVCLPGGIQRSYSLTNPQEERHRYVITVQKERTSRGGSRFMHESLRAGDYLTISAPRNNFPLAEAATHTVLIAGGIGITPLWCMIQRLEMLGRSWKLFFAARSRGNAAFASQLEALANGGNVHFHFDDEEHGRFIDLPSIVDAAGDDAHLYCCGPAAMLEAFEGAAAGLPADRVHTEYFARKTLPPLTGAFTLVLARAKATFSVLPGRTILDTLLEHGMDVQYSCTEGVCGECQTRVLEGIPDHRDVVLTADERASNRTMMICCSGCKGEKLVLDL